MTFCPCGENKISAEFVQSVWSLSTGSNLTSENNGWKVTLAHRAHHIMAIMVISHRASTFFVFGIRKTNGVKYLDFSIQTTRKISNENIIDFLTIFHTV